MIGRGAINRAPIAIFPEYASPDVPLVALVKKGKY